MLTMYKTIEPPIERLHRLCETEPLPFAPPPKKLPSPPTPTPIPNKNEMSYFFTLALIPFPLKDLSLRNEIENQFTR